MPDPIIFVIKDGVDPQIAQNVAAIGAAAKQADGSIQALTQALQAIQNSGVAGLAAQLSSASTSTTRLSNTTAKMAAAALDASQKIDKLVNSYTNLNTSIAASIITLNNFNAAARSAATGTNAFNQGVNNLGRGASGATGNFIASSAALNTLEGKFGSNTRAAGRFLSTTLGLGPALQAAFPIFGAVAFAGVIGIVVSQIDKLALHLHNLTVQAQQDAIALLNSQQVLIKGEHSIGASIGNALLNRDNAPDLQINDPAKVIRELNYQVQINDLIAQRNEFGKTGLALQQAKTAAVKDEITITQAAIQAIQRQRDIIQNTKGTGLLDQQVNVAKQSDFATAKGISVDPIFQPKIPVDSEQFKELAHVASQYDDELDRLNKQLLILKDFKLPQSQLKEPLSAAKDEAKAAAAQLKAFTDQMAKLKGEDRFVSPQEKLDLLLKQRETASKTHPSNVPALDAQIGAATQAIEHQKNALDELDKRYQDQVNDIGLVSDAQKIAAAQSKIEIELIKSGNDPYSERAKHIKENAANVILNATYQKELNKVELESNEPAKLLKEGTRAINDLLKEGIITKEQAIVAQNKLNIAFEDAKFPLIEQARQIQNQTALYGVYGIALEAAAEGQKLEETLRNKGIDLSIKTVQQFIFEAEAKKKLTFEQVIANKMLDDYLAKKKVQLQIDQAVNKLYQENAGAVQKLTASILALNVARQKGIITEQQYDTQLAKLRVDLANINIEMGKFTKGDVLTSVFGNYIKDFKGLTVGIVQTWQQAFDTIANGAANALGRAIAYGENLGAALKDVARQALSELIAGFIKLGIQLLITTIIGKTAGQTSADLAIAQGTAVGAAWAPAAAFASLATLGSNAKPAAIALVATTGLAEALNALHFASGGVVPGYGNKDTVPALLTPGEGVLNKAAMSFLGPSTIQAWNKGQFDSPASGTGNTASGRQSLMLNLIHDKNAVDVVRINESTIRIVAKQEAAKAVSEQSPHVIAAQIAQPSSPVRKSLALHTDVRGAH